MGIKSPGLFCPCCGYPQYCGCDSCRDRVPPGHLPQKVTGDGECLLCPGCGFTAHVDWWLTLVGDIILGSNGLFPAHGYGDDV